MTCRIGYTQMRQATIIALILACSSVAANGAQASDSPTVVELFTSQGCSSCPPADAFLTELAQRKDVLPLAFHITYWDGLGWKDPYSFSAATRRQQDYAESLGTGEVYTPEMVVNGARGFVGSDRSAGLAEIARAEQGKQQHVALKLSRNGNGFSVSVGSGAGRARVILVGYDPEHRTPVGRGENAGRTLLESNIVRSLSEIGQWTGAIVELKTDVPTGERFAVLLQSEDGTILGAATLSSPDI